MCEGSNFSISWPFFIATIPVGVKWHLFRVLTCTSAHPFPSCAGPFHRWVCPGIAVLQEKNKLHFCVSSEITEVTSVAQLPSEIRDESVNHLVPS